ncbi:N-acetylmuramoyl-L-alanine amidase family protein [Romboutsia lituseburensis]|uniref:N-acetylmuramoyl-L-alanine amidase family protein n=1 Tax=Romboutsia lituseburensis TaxID=1537 RepID=UPI00215AA784|nr:N-acetylmuramoyl-L-alanine amidase [Romboutsia lituseburensis]MCR8745413.1 N-acetylmuramoyl-L-alanine amidase [Romboutsia lituseburensis]
MSTKKRVNSKTQVKNTSRKKNIKKKKKVNKKKLILLFSIIGIFMFGMVKATTGISTVVKNMESKKQAEVEKKKALEAKKQFNIEEEQTDGLQKKYTVVIDPGHGGKDPGNKGYSTRNKQSDKKVYEKDLALEISKKVAGILSRQNDVQVVLTRTEDKFVELSERVKTSETQNADVLVSIHMNAEAGGDSAYGIETYYRANAPSNDKSSHLAETIQHTIGSYIKIRDRGIKEDIFQVLRDTTAPAALVECGFISNYKEEQKLLDEKYQNQLSEGIAQGILTFLDENSK